MHVPCIWATVTVLETIVTGSNSDCRLPLLICQAFPSNGEPDDPRS
ncbi:hypothetical protein [Synechococcus sp. BA-132 BA5]|nr:hypothetical protein [Synechococcus sp. BA-132 BA5]MEA5417002.1 hypothetical protein [Synechococcus sp. BA-132 BA5]